MGIDKRQRGRVGLPEGSLRMNNGCWMVKHQGKMRTCRSLWPEVMGQELGRGLTVQPRDVNNPKWPDDFQVVRMNASSAEVRQRRGGAAVRSDKTLKPRPDLSQRVMVPHPTQPRAFVWKMVGE